MSAVTVTHVGGGSQGGVGLVGDGFPQLNDVEPNEPPMRGLEMRSGIRKPAVALSCRLEILAARVASAAAWALGQESESATAGLAVRPEPPCIVQSERAWLLRLTARRAGALVRTNP